MASKDYGAALRPGLRSADAARRRLLDDRACGRLAVQRMQLDNLARRLEQAGRGALMEGLAARVRTDRRLAPVYGALVRMALGDQTAR